MVAFEPLSPRTSFRAEWTEFSRASGNFGRSFEVAFRSESCRRDPHGLGIRSLYMPDAPYSVLSTP